LIAAGIGGLINLGVNIVQGNIKGDIWECIGKRAAAFGAGAVAGDLALYGPAGWAAGGAIVGGTNAYLGEAKGWDIVKGSGIGAISGLAGGAAGQWAAQNIGGVVISGLNVTSPVIKGAIGGAIGGAAGGYAGGFTAGMITTGDIRQANKAGLNGLYSGAAIGTATGAMAGYRYAKSEGRNPWTGKEIAPKAESSNNDFFVGTKYSDKVLIQMQEDNFHGFPESVKSFQQDGYLTTIKGGDGIIRTQLNIPGSYKGYNGEFQFMKEPNGLINHRFFQPFKY
jgi:hypothetical protein